MLKYIIFFSIIGLCYSYNYNDVKYLYHYNYTINKLQKTRVQPCPSENDFWFFHRTCRTVNVSDGKVYRLFNIFDFRYPYTIYNFLTLSTILHFVILNI